MNPFKDFKILYSLLSNANDGSRQPNLLKFHSNIDFEVVCGSMGKIKNWNIHKSWHSNSSILFAFLTKFSVAYFSMMKSSLVTRFYSHCDCVVCECVFFSEVKYKINHGLAHFTFNFFISWLCCYSSSSSFLLLLFAIVLILVTFGFISKMPNTVSVTFQIELETMFKWLLDWIFHNRKLFNKKKRKFNHRK